MATIFTDVISPEWPRVLHKLETLVIPMGIEQSIYTPSALQIVLLCVHAPRVPFLPHPPPFSDGNLYPAARLRIRRNYFRPYLSIFACAIEVQHNNENPTSEQINLNRGIRSKAVFSVEGFRRLLSYLTSSKTLLNCSPLFFLWGFTSTAVIVR